MELPKPDYKKMMELYTKGALFHLEDDYENAIKCYKKALAIDPESETVLGELGKAYYGLKDFNNADKVFDKILTLNKESTLALYNKGCIFAEREDYQKALEYLDQSLKLFPEDAEAWEKKGDIYLDLDKPLRIYRDPSKKVFGPGIAIDNLKK